MIQACSGGSEGMLPLENFEEMSFFTEKWSGQRLALLLTELDGGGGLSGTARFAESAVPWSRYRK